VRGGAQLQRLGSESVAEASSQPSVPTQARAGVNLQTHGAPAAAECKQGSELRASPWTDDWKLQRRFPAAASCGSPPRRLRRPSADISRQCSCLNLNAPSVEWRLMIWWRSLIGSDAAHTASRLQWAALQAGTTGCNLQRHIDGGLFRAVWRANHPLGHAAWTTIPTQLAGAFHRDSVQLLSWAALLPVVSTQCLTAFAETAECLTEPLGSADIQVLVAAPAAVPRARVAPRASITAQFLGPFQPWELAWVGRDESSAVVLKLGSYDRPQRLAHQPVGDAVLPRFTNGDEWKSTWASVWTLPLHSLCHLKVAANAAWTAAHALDPQNQPGDARCWQRQSWSKLPGHLKLSAPEPRVPRLS